MSIDQVSLGVAFFFVEDGAFILPGDEPGKIRTTARLGLGLPCCSEGTVASVVPQAQTWHTRYDHVGPFAVRVPRRRRISPIHTQRLERAYT